MLKRYKKLVFVENESDQRILSILGDKCGLHMPNDVVYWTNTDSHADRKRMFLELQRIIPELKCVSLRDRDMDCVDVVGDGLAYKPIQQGQDDAILLLQWRRKNIESYLLCPNAIARASNKPVEEVKRHFQEKFAIAIDDEGYIEAVPPEAILTLDGKHHFTAETIGLESAFNCNKYDVAGMMTEDEVCEDIKTFITRVNTIFGN